MKASEIRDLCSEYIRAYGDGDVDLVFSFGKGTIERKIEKIVVQILHEGKTNQQTKYMFLDKASTRKY